jgi:H/ACA ribonucleoprotein complex subunit 4
MINPLYKQDRETFILKKSKTSKFGCKPEERSIQELINYGIININKPSGPTSHQVSDYVKKILNISKAGHSGTLDPKVTGCLPVALGRATKIVQALLPAGKEYITLMHLHKPVAEGKIYDALEKFKGKIKQLPPIKSAIKRQIRERTIYYLDVIEISEQDILFRVGCEAGTYIRKLCHDIGKNLDVGAHMQELRRTRVGPFDESTLVTLQDLKDEYEFFKNDEKNKLKKLIQPIENAVIHLPKVWVLDSTVDSLTHGRNLAIPGISKIENFEIGQQVAIMSLKNELIALGKAKMDHRKIQSNEKGIAIVVNKVLMLPGVYPKMQE